jgi:hypothetical protein
MGDLLRFTRKSGLFHPNQSPMKKRVKSWGKDDPRRDPEEIHAPFCPNLRSQMDRIDSL